MRLKIIFNSKLKVFQKRTPQYKEAEFPRILLVLVYSGVFRCEAEQQSTDDTLMRL